MAGRPTINPGVFKTRPNYAGGTSFVAPDLLVGTLRAAWEHIDTVVDPLHRAVMMMFVVTECHPFDEFGTTIRAWSWVIAPLVGVLDFTRKWVGAVDWSDWDRCLADLQSSHAFLDSAVAERSGNRLRLPDLS